MAGKSKPSGQNRRRMTHKRKTGSPVTAERKGTVALERGLSVIAAFSESTPFLTLADLSRTTGLDKATLLRFIHTLERFGHIGYREDGYYYVGVTALKLGRLYQASIADADLIKSALQRLVDKSKESAGLMVREGDIRICAYRINSLYQIRDHVEVGDIRPLGKGAAGRILAAFTGNLEDKAYAKLRESCFCVTEGEIERHAMGAAVPVFRSDGLVGALTVTGPASRMREYMIEELRRMLLDEAIELTAQLGGDPSRLRRALTFPRNANDLRASVG